MHSSILKPATSQSARGATAYHEVHTRSLKVGTELPFALYTRIEGEYIVYRRDNLPYTITQEEALLENGIKTMFIASQQLDKFWEYLRSTILEVIDDPAIPLEERAKLFYRSTTEITKQAMERPLSEKSLSTASTMIQCSLKILTEGKAALHALMMEMDSQPGLFQGALNAVQYGLALAQEVGITDPRELESFGTGLLFMDLGMLQLPQELVFKDGPYSFDEWALIKRHPGMALQMLNDIEGVTDLAKAVVIGHHERIDGSGYPQGLRDDEVSLGLRIIGIVDEFNRMTAHPNPDHRLKPIEALTRMKLEMSAQYDDDLLETFIKLVGASEG